ncbi:carbohydrate-binding module family 21 protein [[Candida] arabinofermentans NRRL YB-2248]|uniref:Carbohydrate-binding module family 21 protein n=1 Tax=[Candida] arabinofermentans NRRL YB-2248 TaxID=983967 RepID=A0A1E4T8Q1_9ASCO|nr:carbohydrate-binding module family 21 protein [[Candida] arabinofermentans NRRL YB-2248]
MPYLGPRSFATAPLTTNNLAYLNDKLLESQKSAAVASSSNANFTTSMSSATSSSLSPEEEELSINTPLSTISSSSSINDLALPTPCHTILQQQETCTIDLDDDNKTVVMKTNKSNSSTSSLSTIRDLPSKPSLLRKKSGELVKSSLRLPSLKRSNSMPNAKSVRFANRLENIKFFDKLEKPIAVSNESSPVNSPRIRAKWEFDSSDEDSETDEEQSEHWEILQNDVPFNSGFVNFSKFNSDKPIIVESLKLNSTKNSLIGFVYVKNIGYEKNILLKLTTDGWKNVVDIDSVNYISSNHIFKYLDSNCSYDKFSFIIKLDSLRNIKSDSLNLSFCIKYEVNGSTYWDSNDSKNYTVLLKKAIKESKSIKTKKFTDLDDIKFKLKTNHNFNDSFGVASPTRSSFNFQPKQSKHYLLKKVNSESSLSDLNKGSIPVSFARASFSGPKSTSYSTFSASTSSSPIPSLNNHGLTTGGSCASNDNKIYNSIIENYCFFGSSSPKEQHLQDQVSPLAADFSSFCLH